MLASAAVTAAQCSSSLGRDPSVLTYAGSFLSACPLPCPPGHGQVCVTPAWSSGRLLLVPPTDSEVCTRRSAGCGPPVTGSLFPAEREGKPVVPWERPPLLGAPEARKSINTVIALPAQISIFLKLNPISEVLLEPGRFDIWVLRECAVLIVEIIFLWIS